jgi:tetratricopeptide (TPR) repeat protein
MAANAFADWLARGRAHQGEARPADAIPCFRRAAREDPRSPVPHFHLGEVLWQLGLTTEALQAWRTAAGLDRTFLAPRLALAEAAMTHGDFASASVVAREACCWRRMTQRARATVDRRQAPRPAIAVTSWSPHPCSPPIQRWRVSPRLPWLLPPRSPRSPRATSATHC